MSAVETISKVLATKLLTPELAIIPGRGATDAEVQKEEGLLGRRLRPDHIALLRRWNGIGLDIIRLFGCGKASGEIGRLADSQLRIGLPVDQALVLGSDASGFLYVQSSDGRILSFDTDGGVLRPLATSLDDFFDRLVFGPDAASFAGEDWRHQLLEAGLI